MYAHQKVYYSAFDQIYQLCAENFMGHKISPLICFLVAETGIK